MFTNLKDLVRDYTYMKGILHSFLAHWDLMAPDAPGPGFFDSQ